MRKILFIAGFPPPASGQLIMQKKMYDLFREEDKILVNLNFSSSSKDFSKKSFKKFFRLIAVVIQITRFGLSKKNLIDKVYYSLSGPKKSALVKDVLIAIPLTLFFKRKLVLQVHAGGYNEQFIENMLLFKCLRRLYNKTDLLLCFTEYQKNELEFIKAKNIRMVSNFCKDIVNGTPLVAKSSNSNLSLKLLSVGHLNENKGITECIYLAKLLKSNKIEFKWKFVGAFQSNGFEQKIWQMISDFNLRQNIIIEKEVANDLIYEEYSQSDFLIFLSNGPEGQPLVLIETLMIAKAVIIARDICGINEYIKNGYNGFLINDYKEALDIILNQDKHDFENIQVNARKTYLKLFSEAEFEKNINIIFKKSFQDKQH